MSAARKGKSLSEEWRQNISKSLKGRPGHSKGKPSPNKGRHQVAWNKGLKASDETKRKLSESHKGQKAWNKGLRGRPSPWKGRKASPELRKKMSDAHKGQIPWNKGVPNSDETRRKISESLMGHIPWNKGMKGCWGPEVLAKIKAARAKQKLPLFDTSIERTIQAGLAAAGIDYKRHQPIRGLPDLMIDKIIVFCDGDRWHANPAIYNSDDVLNLKNGRTAADIWAHDAQVKADLEAMGFTILRFWESDINRDPTACVARIVEAVQAARNQDAVKIMAAAPIAS